MQIEIKTPRALPIESHPVCAAEKEWFVPFIINPAEIVSAKLLTHAYAGYQNCHEHWMQVIDKEITMKFCWGENHQNLTVEINEGDLSYWLYYQYSSTPHGYVFLSETQPQVVEQEKCRWSESRLRRASEPTG